VHVVRQCLHARREALLVGGDEAARVTLAVPAVVDVDVLVARVLHAGRDHRVGSLADHLLAHVAAELVPAVPAELGSLREAIELLRERVAGEQRGE